MSASANDDFLARLDRIREKGGQSVMMVGQDEQYVIPRKVIAQTTRKAEIAGNLVYPASLFGAILLGMVAVFASHYIRFQLMAGAAAAADPTTEMLTIGGMGLVSSFVLSQAFKLTSKEHRALQGMGVALMVFLYPNLSLWLPGPMSAAFSPEYVQTMTATAPETWEEVVPAEAPVTDATQPDETPPAPKQPVLRKAGKIVSGG